MHLFSKKRGFRIVFLYAALCLPLATKVSAVSTNLAMTNWGEEGTVRCYDTVSDVWNDETGWNQVWCWGCDCRWESSYMWWVKTLEVSGTTNGCPIAVTVGFVYGHQETFNLTGNGGSVYLSFYFQNDDFSQDPISASATESCPTCTPTVTLSGPSNRCHDCPGVYRAVVGPGQCRATLYWFMNGSYVGQTSDVGSEGTDFTFSSGVPGPVTYSVSTSSTFDDPSASQTSVTTTIEGPNYPGNGLTFGSFTLVCPSITPAYMTNGDILGITAGASVIPTEAVNCNCGGWALNAAFKIEVTIYHYSDRINNAADIALVCGGELDHVNTFSDCVNAVQGHYNARSATQGSLAAANNLKTDYYNLRIAEVNAMIAINNAFDAQPNGPHPTLGRNIRNHGGVNP